MALRPEVRGRGAAALLMAAGFRTALDAGYEAVILALVGEAFRFLGRSTEATREYALYGRPL